MRYLAKMKTINRILLGMVIIPTFIYSLSGCNLIKNNLNPKKIINNIETKIQEIKSTKLNYTEVKKNGTTYVNYEKEWYKVIETKFIKDTGLDYLLNLAGIKYTEEQRYLNSEYNREHGEGRVPQPGSRAYLLEPIKF